MCLYKIKRILNNDICVYKSVLDQYGALYNTIGRYHYYNYATIELDSIDDLTELSWQLNRELIIDSENKVIKIYDDCVEV